MIVAAAGIRELADALRGTLAAEARRSREQSVVVGASTDLARVDPIATFAAARASGIEAYLWIRAREGTSTVAVGSALTFSARGADRVAALGDRWDALRSTGSIGTAPRAFVGVSFDERASPAAGPRWDGYPPALLVLPRVLVEQRGARATASAFVAASAGGEAELASLGELLDGLDAPTSAPCGAARAASCDREEDLPSAGRWREAAAATREDARSGRIEKAVLARTVRVRGVVGVEGALSSLVTHATGTTVFAVARGGRCFVGATPEPLVRLSGGEAVVSCVAGTAPRDAHPERDAERARALAASEKEREEHDIVVREALAALAPLCREVTSTPPRPKALRNVWHLASEVRGRARAEVDLLDLAAALHPTPAVCGHPRDAARRLLAEREPFDRGWYAGALGWMGADGEGELVVPLRSALCAGGEAWLFAGCGIVAASDPDAELAESEAKLRPMLEALGAG